MKLVSNFLLLLILVVFIGCSPKPSVPKAIMKNDSSSDFDPNSEPEVATISDIPGAVSERVTRIKGEKRPTKQPAETVIKAEEPESLKIQSETVVASISSGKILPTKDPNFQPTLKMFSWNVESDGAEANTICVQLTELNQGDKYDILALTEVLPEDLSKHREALGKHYKYAYSKSGRNDRLQILYNENKFELIRKFEIDEINLMKRYRAPLVVHLKNRETGLEFMVMTNHLARGRAEVRQEQATQLVEWARGNQNLPLIGLGDYNFDYVFETGKGNPAFTNMMRDNIWHWVKPQEMVDTNWYDDPKAPDGIDDYPGSMLDFAFVAGPSKEWKTACNVIVREGDFPDDEKTSDHRPFELLLAE